MKKLAIILIIFASLGCTKAEIKPTEQEKDVITEKNYDKSTVYLVSYPNECIVSGQNYATNEQEIELLCEQLIDYDIILIIIDYENEIISCHVKAEFGLAVIRLKLYSFDSL